MWMFWSNIWEIWPKVKPRAIAYHNKGPNFHNKSIHYLFRWVHINPYQYGYNQMKIICGSILHQLSTSCDLQILSEIMLFYKLVCVLCRTYSVGKVYKPALSWEFNWFCLRPECIVRMTRSTLCWSVYFHSKLIANILLSSYSYIQSDAFTLMSQKHIVTCSYWSRYCNF